MNEFTLYLQEQLSLQDIDVFNDLVLAHPNQPLESPERAEDMVFDGLGVSGKEALGMALLLDGAEKLLGADGPGWQGVYDHLQKWAADVSLRRVWVELLRCKRTGYLYLCSVQLDGSQTICKRGGEFVSFQSRKAARTCNSLFVADDAGMLLPGGGQPSRPV